MIRNSAHKSNDGNGFTIVELLVVIVVIGILAATTVVAYNGITAKTRDVQRVSDIDTITKALEMYYVDNGQYPALDAGVADPCSNLRYGARSGCTSWTSLSAALQPYSGMTTLPSDPINRIGSSTAPEQHSYVYTPMQSTSDWPLLCNSAKQSFQAYYLLYFPEQATAAQNQLIGSCSNTNPFYGDSAGVNQRNYIVTH